MIQAGDVYEMGDGQTVLVLKVHNGWVSYLASTGPAEFMGLRDFEQAISESGARPE